MPKPLNPRTFTLHLALRRPLDASQLEQVLMKDGYSVVIHRSARRLWNEFAQARPRYVITDRRFGDDFDALQLCRLIRKEYLLPYVYIHVLSSLSSLKEIEEALDHGANDYSIKPINPFQLRARVRVGLRWLHYLDSLNLR
ncbi:MAG: response regulator [Verrucomicrobiota bacterium]